MQVYRKTLLVGLFSFFIIGLISAMDRHSFQEPEVFIHPEEQKTPPRRIIRNLHSSPGENTHVQGGRIAKISPKGKNLHKSHLGSPDKINVSSLRPLSSYKPSRSSDALRRNFEMSVFSQVSPLKALEPSTKLSLVEDNSLTPAWLEDNDSGNSSIRSKSPVIVRSSRRVLSSAQKDDEESFLSIARAPRTMPQVVSFTQPELDPVETKFSSKVDRKLRSLLSRTQELVKQQQDLLTEQSEFLASRNETEDESRIEEEVVHEIQKKLANVYFKTADQRDWRYRKLMGLANNQTGAINEVYSPNPGNLIGKIVRKGKQLVCNMTYTKTIPRYPNGSKGSSDSYDYNPLFHDIRSGFYVATWDSNYDGGCWMAEYKMIEELVPEGAISVPYTPPAKLTRRQLLNYHQ